MNYDYEILSFLKKNINNKDIHHYDEVGIVLTFSDGMAIVLGLDRVFLHEIVIFDNNAHGIVINLNSDSCIVFVFDNQSVGSGKGVRRTQKVFSFKLTGDNQKGSIVDIFGNILYRFSERIIEESFIEYIPVERKVPGIVERKSIDTPLKTGVLVIDSLIPIGLGQRQLFMGNRNIGKTSLLVNLIINNKEKDILFIYVSIGQKDYDISLIQKKLIENNAEKECIIVASGASCSSIEQYLAPYVGAAIAEFYAHEKNKNVVIVYDDLSKHAIAYRELSLLMKKIPSRDTYPGDVFYLHSRLLERAGNFKSGGSITALPVVQLQEDDITAFIPTNLISITDGQIFFDTKLFNNGIYPAINSELSVSRVGSAAQYPLISSLSKGLRLYIAQYHELSLFLQFSSELDSESSEKIKRGKLIMTILSQGFSLLYSYSDQVIILYIFKKWYASIEKEEKIYEKIMYTRDYIKYAFNNFYDSIDNERNPNESLFFQLDEYIQEAFFIFDKIK